MDNKFLTKYKKGGNTYLFHLTTESLGNGLTTDSNDLIAVDTDAISSSLNIDGINQEISTLQNDKLDVSAYTPYDHAELWSAIDNEVASRTNGDTEIWNAINQEIATRESDHQAIRSEITLEASARTVSDVTTQNDIQTLNEKITELEEEIEELNSKVVSNVSYDKSRNVLIVQYANGTTIEISFD